MAYLEPKLVVKATQKQVLTPGLVQMVSLLTLNKLELTEMIQQELVQNPVLEEGTEIAEVLPDSASQDGVDRTASGEVDGGDAEVRDQSGHRLARRGNRAGAGRPPPRAVPPGDLDRPERES
jgi:RNA polymerase sigma-54 factor